MGMAGMVKMGIGPLYIMIDPGRRAILRRFRAERQDAAKGAIGGDAEPVPPQHLRQRMGQMEPVKREDGPPLGLHPIDFARLAVIRHRKDADGIGLQQDERIYHHAPVRIGSGGA